jgi:hypothetical protein
MNELKLNNPQDLIAMAIEKGSGIEQLEKLMDLQERWEKKESRKMYFNAFAQFQDQKPVIKKDKKVEFKTKSGGTLNYKFANLNQIQSQIDPILAKLGLSYAFKSTEEGNKLTICCVVTHESGHQEKTQMSAPMDVSGNKNPIQSIGSTNTYLMRYTLCNAFGISADEDNDGQSIEKKKIPELTEVEIKALEESLDEDISRKQLNQLYKSDSKYQTSTEANKLFKAKGIEIEQQKKLSDLYSNIDESKVDAVELMNIERIIEQKETLSYLKAITFLENIHNGK